MKLINVKVIYIYMRRSTSNVTKFCAKFRSMDFSKLKIKMFVEPCDIIETIKMLG